MSLLSNGWVFARDPMDFLRPSPDRMDGHDRYATFEAAVRAAQAALEGPAAVWIGEAMNADLAEDDKLTRAETWEPKRYLVDPLGEWQPIPHPSESAAALN